MMWEQINFFNRIRKNAFQIFFRLLSNSLHLNFDKNYIQASLLTKSCTYANIRTFEFLLNKSNKDRKYLQQDMN